jgi:hypothetical protein
MKRHLILACGLALVLGACAKQESAKPSGFAATGAGPVYTVVPPGPTLPPLATPTPTPTPKSSIGPRPTPTKGPVGTPVPVPTPTKAVEPTPKG